jgi:perosamine synthetase
VAAGREIVPGAPPAAGGIALAVPSIGDEERIFVDEALRSGWIAYGPFVDRFETELARRLERPHVVGLVSGTAALHLALLAVGVRPGDAVPVSTLTFISPAFAIAYAGAVPVFVDAERAHRQLDPEVLETYLREECERRDGDLVERASGRRVGAIVAVDVLGHPAPLERVAELAQTYAVPLVEDAAEGLGATLGGRPCGSFGDVAALSFNGNKIVTAGGGGAVATDDEQLAARVRHLATQAKADPLEYVHDEIGFNYRLSNLHAALGYGQLLRLEEFVAAKRRIAHGYAEAFADVPGVETPRAADDVFSTDWLYTVHVHPEEYGLDSRELLRRLAEESIQARPLWQPLHRSPSLADAPRRECPVADDLHETGLSLPCSVDLTPAELERVVDVVRRSRR